MTDDAIDFGSWDVDAVQYALEGAEEGDERGEDDGGGALAPEHQPRVALPESRFGCVQLDVLKDHPAVDSMVRAELEAGVPFRILRFPFSLQPPQKGRVDEVRYSVRLEAGGAGEPSVYSIYPQRLEVEHETTTEAALEPTLSIGSAVDVGLGRLGRTMIARHARATTVGFWSEQGAEWLLRPPAKGGDGLEGSWEFLAVVRWVAAVAPLRVTLSVSATVAVPGGVLRRTRRVSREYEAVSLAGCIPVL